MTIGPVSLMPKMELAASAPRMKPEDRQHDAEEAVAEEAGDDAADEENDAAGS